MDESWKAMFWKRFLPGFLLIGIGVGILAGATGGAGGIPGGGAMAFFAFGFLIPGAIFLAKPIAEIIVSPILGMLYPNDHSYRPPPLYRLPEMYVRQGRYEEAVQEYQKILHHHPRELRAYRALLEVAFLHLQDIELAAKVHKAGVLRLKNSEEQAQLEETFQALQAGAPLATSSIESYP